MGHAEKLSYPLTLLRTAADCFSYFSIIRKSAERLLREHQITVDHDLEIAVRAFDETC
jgi:hypothetical protein